MNVQVFPDGGLHGPPPTVERVALPLLEGPGRAQLPPRGEKTLTVYASPHPVQSIFLVEFCALAIYL